MESWGLWKTRAESEMSVNANRKAQKNSALGWEEGARAWGRKEMGVCAQEALAGRAPRCSIVPAEQKCLPAPGVESRQRLAFPSNVHIGVRVNSSDQTCSCLPCARHWE